MNIARKLTTALLACVVVALVLNALTVVTSEIARYEDEVSNHQRVMARALRPAITQVWRTEGRTRALDVVEEANRGFKTVDIRWVWLDAPGAAEPRWRPSIDLAELATVLAGEDATVVKRDLGPAGRIVSYAPLRVPGERPGAIEVSESLDHESGVRRSAWLSAAITGLALMLASALVTSALGAWFVGRPMRGLVAQADRIGAGDLSVRVDLAQRDEVGTLAAAMNTMCDRLIASQVRENRAVEEQLRALDQLRHADRLATVGRLAAGMAHELGTPLNVVAARAKSIGLGQIEGDAVRDSGRVIAEQAERMARLMRQLLDFARKRELHTNNTDLGGVVRRTVAFLSSVAAKRGVSILMKDPETPVEAKVDAAFIEQVITNLLVNAIDASGTGQTISISLARCEAVPPVEDGRGRRLCARIEVRDAGLGISADNLARVFEPFFTTKPVGEGTGLGLSVSHGIVNDHGGWITVTSDPGDGTAFVVYLPTT